MSDTPHSGPAEPAARAKTPGQKVPPFARFKGTSAWRKDRRRVRAYALFRAAAKEKPGASPAS